MGYKYNPLFGTGLVPTGSPAAPGSGMAFQESLGTGDGVTTSFGPLTNTPIDEDSIAVFIDSLIEDKSGWSLSGGNIVFSSAPAAAQKIYVYYLY